MCRSRRRGEYAGFEESGPYREPRPSPQGCSVAGLCDTLSLNVSSPSDSWGRWTAAVAAGRRGLPSKESAKQRCSQHPPQSGSAISLFRSEPAHPRKRESTCEIESSIPHRVAPSRNATPKGGPTRWLSDRGAALRPHPRLNVHRLGWKQHIHEFPAFAEQHVGVALFEF